MLVLDDQIIFGKVISTPGGRVFMLGGTSDLKFSKLFKRNIELNHNMRLNSYTSTAKSDML